MNRIVLGAIGAAAIATSSLAAVSWGAASVHAAERGREFAFGPERAWSRLSPEDRSAFADARIAGLRAGLRLSAEQEKLWPPVEDAIRNLQKVRREQRETMRDRFRDGMTSDVPATLRAMADAQGARSEALRRLADASTPLYATLDEAQKRRALVLARPFGRGMMDRQRMERRGMRHGRGDD